MKEYNLEGITVQFPHAAYNCQLDLMSRVIQSLQHRQNALLESPTGTGKTCSILCSTLAWLQAYKALSQLYSRTSAHELKQKLQEMPQLAELHRAVVSSPPINGSGEDFINNRQPVIYYASRTHSQLSQAVQELQSTAYKDSLQCVLGSREQMCIEPSVKKQPSNSGRTAHCRQLVQQKKCRYNSAVQQFKYSSEMYRHMDIEELVEFGTVHGVCPYYLSREVQTMGADIVFLPYNYLIDPVSRASQNINVNNAIIVFDEAHNLESICSEATSFEIGALDVASAIDELAMAKDLISMGGGDSVTVEDLDALKVILLKFEEKVAAIEMRQSDLILPAQFIFSLFEDIGITFDNSHLLVKVLDAVCMLLNGESASMSSSMGRRKGGNIALQKILGAARTLFHPDNKAHLDAFCDNYKIYISNESVSQNKKSSADIWSSKKSAGRSVSFWCFSSGVAMKSLIAQGCRSVILTSGTLSPLDSFAAELQIPFHHILENPHVIDPSQIFVGIIPKGPSNQPLNSSFKNREVDTYKTDLGNALVNFCRVIPDGILVFFPAYGVMEQCIEAWKRPSGDPKTTKAVFDRIKQFKEPYVEPKEKTEFGKAMQNFYTKISDCSDKGAIFFAVCRGKASEGIDFSDTRGRAVVITGIPYPAFKDPRVVLKRQFLDDLHNKRNRFSKVVTITGETWYKQQAARAVNQALGRVIRHRNDWGAVLLCDDRFLSTAAKSQLPVWVRPHVMAYGQFGEAQVALTRFMNRRSELDKFKQQEKAKEPPRMPEVPNGELKKRTGGHLEILKSNPNLFKRHNSGFGKDVAPTSRNHLEVEYENNAGLSRHTTTADRVAANQGASINIFARKNSAQHIATETSNNPVSAKIKAGSGGFSRPAVDSVSREEKKKEIAFNAKAYLEEIKTTLPKDVYKQFQKVLKSFKEKSIKIQELTEMLEQLFGTAERYHLFSRLVEFLPSVHQPYFRKKSTDFEARFSGKRDRENESGNADGDGKKQKIDNIIINEAGEVFIASDDDTQKPPVDNSPSTSRICAVCNKKPKSPFEAKCTHLACHECWLLWLKNRPECPVCQKPTRMKHLKKLYFCN